MLVLQDHLCYVYSFKIAQTSCTSDSSNRNYCFILKNKLNFCGTYLYVEHKNSPSILQIKITHQKLITWIPDK